jgi:RNA recognition motif-containing protein
VKHECMRFGNVLHCYVDKYSDGDMYLMFDDVSSCRRAAEEMNGRWYNKRTIQVS